MKISKTQITIETYRETVGRNTDGACPMCGHERQPSAFSRFETCSGEIADQDSIPIANKCNGNEILDLNKR